MFLVGNAFINKNNCEKASLSWFFQVQQKKLFQSKLYFSEPSLGITLDYTFAPLLLESFKSQEVESYKVNPNQSVQDQWQTEVVIPLTKQYSSKPQIAALSSCNSSLVYFNYSDDSFPPTTIEMHDLQNWESDISQLKNQFNEPDVTKYMYKITENFWLIPTSPDGKHLVIKLYQSSNADFSSYTQTNLVMQSLFLVLTDKKSDISLYPADNPDIIKNGGYIISPSELNRL